MSDLWTLKNASNFSFSPIFALKNRRHLTFPIQYHTFNFNSGAGNWKFLILLLLATQNLHKSTTVLFMSFSFVLYFIYKIAAYGWCFNFVWAPSVSMVGKDHN